MNKRVAQVFEFPALKHIPPPEMPLEGDAFKKYMELARQLLDKGSLTNSSRMMVEQYSMLHQEAMRRYQQGKSPSMSMVTMMQKLMADLHLVEQSTERPTSEKKENRYSRFGVITRRWA